MPTRYGVGLVEQAVTDLACEMGAEAVKLGLERFELLRDVSERGLYTNTNSGPYFVCPARLCGLVLLAQHLLLEAVLACRPCRLVLVDEFGSRPAGSRGASTPGP